MSDFLYDAAIEYKKLENVVYRIILGRKGKKYELMLRFPPESFFHLAGLQHLTDIKFPSSNKERVYKEILRKRVTEETIRKSVFFDSYHIAERISNLYLIETMLKSDSITYLINPNIYRQFCEIRADYLCRYEKTKTDIFYLFSVIVRTCTKFANECHACSFFKKHDRDYTRGCAMTTTLMIQRIVDMGTEDEMISLFIKTKYIKSDII